MYWTIHAQKPPSSKDILINNIRCDYFFQKVETSDRNMRRIKSYKFWKFRAQRNWIDDFMKMEVNVIDHSINQRTRWTRTRKKLGTENNSHPENFYEKNPQLKLVCHYQCVKRIFFKNCTIKKFNVLVANCNFREKENCNWNSFVIVKM